ncbi:MAG: PH domain-containing protein [Ruminococcus sp.]|nr:PH domain-containing protein [Ruminococcus sp.]
MRSFKPDKHALLTLRLVIVAVSLLLFFAVRMYISLTIVLAIIGIAILTVDIFFICIYLPLYFKSLSYDTTDTEITKHSGVYFISHQSVLYSTVQYTTVITTPFSQYTGLNFVVFFVYGGQLRLLFLKQEDALYILRKTGAPEKEAEK